MSNGAMAEPRRIFLVTGGTSGVGRAIALDLARQGAHVVVVGRSPAKAAQEIAAASGNSSVEPLVADLSLQSSVEAAVAEYCRRFDRLDCLVNAAGAIIHRQQTTAEGRDLSLAVNYLGHFILTTGLLDQLARGRDARVLTVGGNPRFLKSPDLDIDRLFRPDAYRALPATLSAMLARIHFSFELARRLEGSAKAAIAFHPGLIRSNLTRGGPLWFRLFGVVSNLRASERCDVGAWLATLPDALQANGAYFDDQRERLPLPSAFDPAVGRRLWERSEATVRAAR
jgi:NAD(P)-dependent dehydrogenase (short-subunit alcohol dehydrogenase family)